MKKKLKRLREIMLYVWSKIKDLFNTPPDIPSLIIIGCIIAFSISVFDAIAKRRFGEVETLKTLIIASFIWYKVTLNERNKIILRNFQLEGAVNQMNVVINNFAKFYNVIKTSNDKGVTVRELEEKGIIRVDGVEGLIIKFNPRKIPPIN